MSVFPTQWSNNVISPFRIRTTKNLGGVYRSKHIVARQSYYKLGNSSNSFRLRAVIEEEGNTKDSFDSANVKKIGALWEGTIKSTNKGGVVVKGPAGKAFCPYSKLDPSRLNASGTQLWGEIDQSHLVGETVNCLVQDINKMGQLVVSEKAYYMKLALDYYKPGDSVSGKVVAMEDYGAFIDIPMEDGEYHGVRGLLHISDMSWDVVTRPEDVVNIGDEVTTIVKTISRNLNRLSLTLKTDDSDPLKESVSSLLPLEGEAYDSMTWEPLQDMIPGLNAIMETLQLQSGIEDVQPRRQAEVRHKVSKDLELWLSKEEVEDGFNLVAWSGRTLQEIHVRTEFTREGMKSTLEKVLRQAM
eukprot:g171.t1